MPDYITVVDSTPEVSLYLEADIATWEPILQAEGLQSYHTDKVEILISTVISSYMGIQFRELAVSIRTGEHSFFLIQAYNSNRFFAFAERAFFNTPYKKRVIAVHQNKIILGEQFEAVLPEQAACIKTQDETQEWLLQLPAEMRKRGETHFFYIKVEGNTRYYEPDGVQLHIAPRENVWTQLNQSHLRVRAWLVRECARHSKSKTYHQ